MTARQKVFAAAYAKTGDSSYAASKAGYAFPVSAGKTALLSPEVLHEVRRHQAEYLQTELVPAALTCLHNIMTDPAAPAGARVSAAKVVIDRGLPGAQELLGTGGKAPHEMSPEELADAIARLEARAAELARPVAPTSVLD